MVTLEDAAAIARELPEVTDGTRHGNHTWFVGKKAFAWERPFSKADIKRFGDATPPDGEILAVSVEDLHEKEAILAEAPKGFFTIEHFNGYPALLIQLRVVTKRALREAIVDAWLAVAPPALAEEYLTSRRGGSQARPNSLASRGAHAIADPPGDVPPRGAASR